MKICDFTTREIEYLRKECNFTPDEIAFFDLRNKDKSLVEICFEMHISKSKADALSKKVKKKIMKVL